MRLPLNQNCPKYCFKDWAGISWGVGTGHNPRIVASGWTREGFNLSLCTLPGGGSGWNYARGYADFSVTFTLDRSYRYISTVSGDVTGISNGEGFLPAGTHTISGHSLGNPPGGFSLDVLLPPGQPQPPIASFTFAPQDPGAFSPQDPIAGELERFPVVCTTYSHNGQTILWRSEA
jgi:hypothetical protein